MVDPEKVQRKLEVICRCLGRLESLRQSGREEFLTDFRLADASKHNLQVAVEAMIDVANHVVARMGYEIPVNHAEAFATLARMGWLSVEDVPRYAAMARFRNRVVHLYEDVDDDQVYAILQEHLGDFRSFTSAVAAKLIGG